MTAPASAAAPVARTKLVVGNWKMHGSRSANATLLAAIEDEPAGRAGICVCAPFPYLADVAAALDKSTIRWGAQDCSAHESGAYTGEVSAAMLADIGCRYVIVGHSERRALHGESDVLVAAKAERAIGHGLVPIVCLGETLVVHEAAATESVVLRQLAAVVSLLGADISKIVLAYEPVWAIGTGKTASSEQAQAVHACLRVALASAGAGSISIIYGGSVKADNAVQLFSQHDIDGGLIGGASLKAAEFVAICRAAG